MTRKLIFNNYFGYKGLILLDYELQNAYVGKFSLSMEVFPLSWSDRVSKEYIFKND